VGVVVEMSSGVVLSSVTPPVWGYTFATCVQVTIFLFGLVQFSPCISFCQATNGVSKRHPWVKTILMIFVFLYPPLTLIAITFMWISYSNNWAAGYFFILLPFMDVVFFFLALFATHNDVTDAIDLQRKIRRKLPAQLQPDLVVVPPGGEVIDFADQPEEEGAVAGANRDDDDGGSAKDGRASRGSSVAASGGHFAATSFDEPLENPRSDEAAAQRMFHPRDDNVAHYGDDGAFGGGVDGDGYYSARSAHRSREEYPPAVLMQQTRGY
jgi:hypothetical protein